MSPESLKTIIYKFFLFYKQFVVISILLRFTQNTCDPFDVKIAEYLFKLNILEGDIQRSSHAIKRDIDPVAWWHVVGKSVGCHLLGKHFRFILGFGSGKRCSAPPLPFWFLSVSVPAATRWRRKQGGKSPQAKCQEQQKKTRANRATSQNYLRPQMPPLRLPRPLLYNGKTKTKRPVN